jgi:hypothetical protein
MSMTTSMACQDEVYLAAQPINQIGLMEGEDILQYVASLDSLIARQALIECWLKNSDSSNIKLN